MRAAVLLVAAGCGSQTPAELDGAVAGAIPQDLRDTGLYSDWASRTIAPSSRSYTPGFELFSDGATKSRWIALPPGTQIDASDLDEVTFPMGTKLWKEFRHDITAPDGSVLAEQRIETRMLWKQAPHDWAMVTYVWSADQADATLADETAPPPIPFPGTTDYEVPVLRCHQCHDGRKDKVLGFEAMLLAAPEADQRGVTWAGLRADGLVGSAAALPDDMQFLATGSELERQAAGYLHTNCGIACHHAGSGQVTPFFMRLEARGTGAFPARIEDTTTFQTAVNVGSLFVPPDDPTVSYRIRPTDHTRSTLAYRMDVRTGLTGGGAQMPPIASHRVDTAGLATIDAWIDAMTTGPYP